MQYNDILDNISICVPLSWQEGKCGQRIAQALSERGARVFAFAASSAEAMDFAAKVNKTTNRQGVVGLRCDQLKSLNVTYNAVITDGSFYVPDGNFKNGSQGGLFNNLERLIKAERENKRLIDENARLRGNIFDQQERLREKAEIEEASRIAIQGYDALEHVSSSRGEYSEEFIRLRKEKEEWEEKCRCLHDVLIHEESAKMDRALVEAKDAQARKRQVERILTSPAIAVSTIDEELGNRKDPEQAPEYPDNSSPTRQVRVHVQQQNTQPSAQPSVQSAQSAQPSTQPKTPTAQLNGQSSVPTKAQPSVQNGQSVQSTQSSMHANGQSSAALNGQLNGQSNILWSRLGNASMAQTMRPWPTVGARRSPMTTPRSVLRTQTSPIQRHRVVRSVSCSEHHADVTRSISSANFATQNPRFHPSPSAKNRDSLSYHGSWAALPQNSNTMNIQIDTVQAQTMTFAPSPRLLNVKLPVMLPWSFPQGQ